ncbi:hypothetical protein ABEB36_013450 [Hypothenemus hampei]|uniref:Uncharacterized protein n=1 Tax=Hypothenemus hampei TaxID=57062 RepID=A0ABD1E838_HYPHA
MVLENFQSTNFNAKILLRRHKLEEQEFIVKRQCGAYASDQTVLQSQVNQHPGRRSRNKGVTVVALTLTVGSVTCDLWLSGLQNGAVGRPQAESSPAVSVLNSSTPFNKPFQKKGGAALSGRSLKHLQI